MDSLRALIGKVDNLARPGAQFNTQAGAYPALSVGSAVNAGGGSYVTWSGTSATVHTLLIFGWAGHGFGSEFA